MESCKVLRAVVMKIVNYLMILICTFVAQVDCDTSPSQRKFAATSCSQIVESPAGSKERFTVEAQLGFLIPLSQPRELREEVTLTAELGFVEPVKR